MIWFGFLFEIKLVFHKLVNFDFIIFFIWPSINISSVFMMHTPKNKKIFSTRWQYYLFMCKALILRCMQKMIYCNFMYLFFVLRIMHWKIKKNLPQHWTQQYRIIVGQRKKEMISTISQDWITTCQKNFQNLLPKDKKDKHLEIVL